MRTSQSRSEQGSALAMAMLILMIIAAIMLIVSTSTMSSMFQTKRKLDRATGMAAADSAIETIRVALNSHLMDESDGYSLNEADLKTLVADRDGTVMPNSQSSDLWGMSKVLVSPDEAFTVREPADTGYSYWQVMLVHEPRYDSARPNDLTIYIRAWATQKADITAGGTNITTQPRVFRVEFRPGYFSDYQSISDGPFFTQPSNPTWTLSGPIHTNGFQGEEWITQGKSGFDLRSPAKCTDRARLTASQGAPVVGLGKCQNFLGSTDARQISLLDVDKTLQYMRSRCGLSHGVTCFLEGHKEYNIQLTSQGVNVDGQMVPLVQNVRCGIANSDDCGDEVTASVLVDGDVNLSGTVTGGAKAARVTIATMRQDPNDQAARVWIQPTPAPVGAGNPDVDSVGVISQGDIIMGIRPNQCGTALNIAGIAQSGSLTMPRELVTVSQPNVPSIQSYVCPSMKITGSVAMHGALISNMSWNQMGLPVNAGYQKLGFTYAPALYDNPPPFYALTYPWAMTKVKDADKRCIEGAAAKDPRCE